MKDIWSLLFLLAFLSLTWLLIRGIEKMKD